MKSRSHRLPISEPHHDDWVDGSWTVDCICGVNFDDGEEMVDCDECGVWVHTRCSRYVKSEKSFSCDKCKSKNSGSGGGAGSGGVRNDSEETEVAEFLVELPTKTLRMDNPNPARNSMSRRPFRLWTDIPMEERVHVQGVPGGEPGLFSGMKMSSVFGPELWKCTGYVPKKLNFRYTEFPCLSHGKIEEKKEEELDKTSGEDNAHQADNNAGVLFSFTKENENTLPTPIVDSHGVKSPDEGGGCHEVVSSRQKKLDGQNLDFGCPEDSMKKESISVPIVLHSGKRKKEELKDQNVKKKGRTIEKEGDIRKRATHSSKAASACDAKHLAFSQDRGSKAVSDDTRCSKDLLGDQLSDGLGECATNLASNEHGLESTLRNDVSSDEVSRGGNRVDQVPVGSENFSKTNNGVESLTQLNGSRSTPVKEEVPGDTAKGCGDVGRVTGGISHEERVAVDVDIAGTDANENRDGQDSDIDEAYSRPNKKIKGELDADDRGRCHVEYPPPNDVKSDSMKAITQYPESSLKVFSEEGKVIEKPVISSEASEPKMLHASRSQTLSTRTDKSDDSLDTLYQSKREPTGSEGPMAARKRSLGLKHSSEVADDLLKSNGTARSHSTASYQRKAVFSLAKSASTSGGISSKSSDNRVAATSQNPSIHNRQKELSESNAGTLKENASADTVEHEEKCGRPKKLVKESSKSNSLSKISDPTKLSQTSDSKRLLSDSKDSSIHSSSKAPLVPNMPSNRVSGECASTLQIEGALNVQNKAAASAVPGKSEKVYQSGSHPSSRGNVTSMNALAASNIPATLSDEELALLLHQELNSSPRVPRVPRMRHAGSLPQLTCPSATSMLMKRTSSGGKDHGMASRRRTKDFSGEGSHGSLEADNEAKKMERKPSSPDNRRRDSGCPADLLSRKEADGGPVKSVQSMKKTNVSGSLSSPSDSNGHNLLSSRSSSRNASDDDPRMVSRLTNRTLPGLIAEIMSEGKRMTYEELCNAVLPHWPNLRKHNGERYAYSSHSQAVLDCLRNRSEWARLVDRGPKTSASRKRRKLDADSMSIESEDNEENRVKNAKDVGSKSFESHQEDFPKGKRKARKRRRLALQGRGIVRRRRRADVVSDDESESFSNSSEDSMSSEEEIQGGGTSIVGSEASASSDEVR
ncbi:uncharacterized protein LOC105156064 isoform X1 [Sesamum indicum]|uniref:Uncharacterized protein LOC105156064 isoform X1 n=1 Tax=Sesamum indicum TaxID=4182 RepID=A0A6I9SKH6_SESIN|nr:uncharacterized protein LOC105156064 isoform X1 [Sesamum indicum]